MFGMSRNHAPFGLAGALLLVAGITAAHAAAAPTSSSPPPAGQRSVEAPWIGTRMVDMAATRRHPAALRKQLAMAQQQLARYRTLAKQRLVAWNKTRSALQEAKVTVAKLLAELKQRNSARMTTLTRRNQALDTRVRTLEQRVQALDARVQQLRRRAQAPSPKAPPIPQPQPTSSPPMQVTTPHRRLLIWAGAAAVGGILLGLGLRRGIGHRRRSSRTSRQGLPMLHLGASLAPADDVAVWHAGRDGGAASTPALALAAWLQADTAVEAWTAGVSGEESDGRH